MAPNLKSLFGIKKTETSSHQADIPQANTPATSQNNTSVIRPVSGYRDYGTRECGICNGSTQSLPPYLQRIYHAEKMAQINNTAFQESQKQHKQNELSDLEQRISHKHSEIALIENRITENDEQIGDYNTQMQQLKSSIGTINKNAQLKLCIGTLILIILTFYLFIFYSSTFYSAFFRDFTTEPKFGIGDAIFDAQAIAKSLEAGVGQMMFVLSAPIIFLGLGFSLHYFSQEESKTKYFKITTLIIVTFVFDCILAYSIAKKFYDFNAQLMWEDQPAYTLKDAIGDSHVWAVIFCGFVVYIIWGIVFSMTMNAFENLRSNKTEIAVLKSKIANVKEKVAKLKAEKIKQESELADLNAKHKYIEAQLAQGVTIIYSDIKVALSEFFTGWTALLVPLGKRPHEIENTNEVYKTTIDTLIPQD